MAFDSGNVILEVKLKGKRPKNKHNVLISLDDLESIVNGINGLAKHVSKQLISKELAKDKKYFSKEFKEIFSLGLISIEEGSPIAVLGFGGFRQENQETINRGLTPDFITTKISDYISGIDISENKLHLEEAMYLTSLLKPINSKKVSVEISAYTNEKRLFRPKTLTIESKEKVRRLIDTKKLMYGEEIYGLLKDLNIKDYSLQLQLFDNSMEKVYFDNNRVNWEKIRDMLGSKVRVNLFLSKKTKTLIDINRIESFQEKRSMTGKDAMDNALFGILKNNEEMKDSVAFAEKLAEDVFSG